MKKQKFSLDSDLVQIDEDALPQEDTAERSNITITPAKDQKVHVTLAIESYIRTDMKTWCAKNNIRLKDALLEGFKLLKEKYRK